MKRLFQIALCLLLVVPTLLVFAQESSSDAGASRVKGERRALLISVSNYASKKFPSLPSTDADVELMKAELLKSGFELRNIRVLQNHRTMPTRENIVDSVNEFAESCGSEDLAFLMLTGHGMRDEETKKDFFLPLDAKESDFSTFVPLDDIIDKLESSRAKFKWLLVDACRTIDKGLSDGSSLGKLEPKPGMLIFQSSAPGEVSYTTNNDGSGNGLFVYHFVQGLQGGAVGADGRVTVLGAFNYAREKIEDRQNPMMSSKEFNDFVLNENEEWTLAAEFSRKAQAFLDEGNFVEAQKAINSALVLDSPLYETYLKKANLISKLTQPRPVKSEPAEISDKTGTSQDSTNLDSIEPEPVDSPVKTVVSQDSTSTDSIEPKPADLPVKFELPQDYTDMNGSKFRLIKAGSFMMGSKLSGEEVMKKYPNGGNARFFNDATRHNVTLTQDFYLCKHPVTRGEFSEFVSATGYKTTAEKEGNAYTFTKDGWKDTDGASWKNPGFAQTDAHPVVCVSYEDALAYIEWLNNKSKVDDKLGGCKPAYRLPTEAEWEYSCRAGTTGEFFWGDDEEEGKGYLNGADETKAPNGEDWSYHFSFSDGYSATSPVGSFKSNPWGLYDMLGNVWEWTSDWYGDYPTGNATDPTGASTGSYRVLRGGSWRDFPASCRCAYRGNDAPSGRSADAGFRVAFSLTSK